MKSPLACIASMLLPALLAVSARPAQAAPPPAISFQGVLVDAAGQPVADGNHNVTFRLFDLAAGGAALWTETDKAVAVQGGHGEFTTALGEPTPFGGLPFNIPYYLEVQVSGEALPMRPRIPLRSVPYSLNAAGGSASLTLPFSGTLSTANSIGITVQNTGSGGSGVRSITDSGRAFWGTTNGSYGVYAEALTTGIGIQGKAVNNTGVGGISDSGYAVAGVTNTGFGVYAQANGSGGGAVRAISSSGRALWATCTGASYGAYIENTGSGIALNALSVSGAAVGGTSQSNYGVFGASGTGVGAYGQSNSYDGVQGKTNSSLHAGVAGINTTSGFGVYGQSQGGGYAGYFDGRVRVAVLEIAGGSDLAENFHVTGGAEPGTVMCIDAKHPGSLCLSEGGYNRKVAGIISGANKLGVGMVLPNVNDAKGALPLAMSGRVWVKCDASNGPIEPGDLLTTSDSPGRAMKATDYAKAMGASVGKAMTSLDSGDGYVLVLVNLQ